MRDWRASGGRLSASGPCWLAEQAFRRNDVPAVRRFTEAYGARAGIPAGRLADLVLAVSEAAACATAWEPCGVRVRLWLAGRRVFCEVRGDGFAVRRRPVPFGPVGWQGEEEALRRWVLRQITDHVSVASGRDGVRVVLSLTAP
ncbi:MAG TPA: ATP-binding protein [Trebonia sp.]|nr:ATP-binding protein [Trebonia sp.]